jgi:hypothetical protein
MLWEIILDACQNYKIYRIYIILRHLIENIFTQTEYKCIFASYLFPRQQKRKIIWFDIIN